MDSEILQQAFGYVTVARWTFNRLCAAVAEEHPVPSFELVPLGVSAEVVVVIENKDARF